MIDPPPVASTEAPSPRSATPTSDAFIVLMLSVPDAVIVPAEPLDVESTAASANAPGPDVVIVAAASLTCELAPSATTPKPVAEETPPDVVTAVGPVALMSPPRNATRPDAPAPPVEIDTPEMVVVPPVEVTRPCVSSPCVEILVPVKLALVPVSSVNTPMARRPVVVTEPPVTVVAPPLLVKTPNASEPVVTMVKSVSFNAPPPTMPFVPLYTPGEPRPVFPWSQR